MSLSTALVWFLIGVLFLIAEFIIPGFVIIFFSAGAWITALVLWMFDISLHIQIILFIVSSLVLLFTLRKYGMNIFKGTTRENIDDHYADSKIGQTAIVTKAISPTKPGEVKMLGSFWMATADTQIDVDTSVIVESQSSEGGLTFKVRKA